MGHNFYCNSCGSWRANCGFSDDNNSTPWSFSSTCICGKRISGSFGGKSLSNKEIKKDILYYIKCENCNLPLSNILKNHDDDKDFSIDVTPPKCNSKKNILEKM